MTDRIHLPLARLAVAVLAAIAVAALVGACGGSATTDPDATATPVPTGSFAETPSASADASPDGSAAVSPGGAYVRVPGTRVSMIPQGGFVPASAFAGFGDPSGAAIEVTDIDQPFGEIEPQFTAAELASEGIEVDTRDVVTLPDGREAILVSGTQTIDGVEVQKIILLTGDAAHAALITANVPFSAPDDVEPTALQMVLSTRFEP